MITQRSEYKIADVTAVPSITGDIIPVRDGTGRLPVLKMEDIAFLVEAFCERGLGYVTPPAVLFPPKVDTIFYVIGLTGTVRSEDVDDGVNDLVYGTGNYGYNAGYRACYPLRPDAAVSYETSDSLGYRGESIFAYLRTNNPGAFWWSSQLPVHYQDFQLRPVAASVDLVRRLFYMLRIFSRWLIVPRDSSEDWHALSLSGTATYTYSRKGDTGPAETHSGEQGFSDKSQVGTVTVRTDGQQVSTITTMIHYSMSSSSRDTEGYDRQTTVVNVSDARFKTRIRFASLSVLFQYQISARGYCRRAGVSTQMDSYGLVRSMSCRLVSELSDDPDGFVQEWAVNLPGLSPIELRAFALQHGFRDPGTTSDTFGSITVAALTDCCLDGIPDWRTEIDSTGWDWEPPE